MIRLMAGGADSPWPGALVCGPTGETSIAVDADSLGFDWTGWAAEPSGHLLGPVDILRRADGHDVLLPVCTERLEEFLARRAGGAQLTAGECVTVAVSLLRATAELTAAESRVSGTWWLTEAGKPVLATETGQAPHEGQTAEHLRHLAEQAPVLAAALLDAAAVVAEPRHRTRELERAEAAIFAVADPLALATTTFGPKLARDRSIADARPGPVDAEPAPPSWVVSLSRHVDADWADLVSRTTTGVWRALRAPRTGRRRPWLLAGGIAGVVLVGGLMWPTGGAGPATAEVPVGPTATPTPSPASAPAGQSGTRTGPGEKTASDPPVDASTDLAAITADLLTARSACGQEESCLGKVQESGGARFPSGVVDLPADERTVALLDEFGGAAVLRAEASGSDATPQLVVIVRTDERWLLRDVYDVPKQ